MSPEGIITLWNAGAERLFLRSRDEATGQSSRMIFTPEDEASGAHDREFGVAAAEGRAEDDRWHIRRDGSRFWATGVLMAIRSETGSIEGFVKVVREKTEERRLQEHLRRSEEQFARLFLANPAPMCVERRDNGAFVLANEAFLNLIGYWRSETLGRSASDLRLWADSADRTSALDRLAAGSPAETVVLNVRPKHGPARRCFASLSQTALDSEPCILTTLIPEPPAKSGAAKAEQ
jgi:PAS domain S-box-containing protein